MVPIHTKLAAGRWAELSLSEQLANIGSEVTRLAHARRIRDEISSEKALDRALELLDLTLKETKSPGSLFEISRLREFVCAVVLGGKEYDIDSQSLEDYFLPFALHPKR